MGLTPVDILNGIFGLVYIIIATIVGFSIISKYYKNKNINLLYVGILYIFLGSPWWGITSSFIAALFNNGVGLPLEIILLLSFIPLPTGLLFWMLAFSNFLYQEKKSMTMFAITAFTIYYWVHFLLVYIINGADALAILESPVDTRSVNVLFVINIFAFIAILLITGMMFAWKTMKIDDPETKLKGKLLLIAFPAFSIGAILDAAVRITAITLIIFRSLLIVSAIFFYAGFILPEWFKKFAKK